MRWVGEWNHGRGVGGEDDRKEGEANLDGATVDDGSVCGGKMQEGGIFVVAVQRMRGRARRSRGGEFPYTNKIPTH